MSNVSKRRGTAAETAVVRALRTLGFPAAERRALHGTADLGDITGTPGICWEVKGGDKARTAGDALISKWLAETERERAAADADIGVLVVQRAGVGPARAHLWWAYTTSAVTARLVAAPTRLVLPDAVPVVPVRLTLADLARLLVWAGYGVPPLDSAVEA